MHHVITVADVLKAGGISLLICAVVGGIVWFISQFDFSK